MRANPEALMIRKLLAATAAIAATTVLTPAQSRRPLAIEDYYRVLTITNPQILGRRRIGQVLRHHARRVGQQHEDGALHRGG